MSTKYLNSDNILKKVYDPSTEGLRTTAVATFVGGSVDIAISDLTDSIKIGDGTGVYLDINADGSTNTRQINRLITTPFDYISGAFPSPTIEIYTYKTGGAGGTIVGIVTVTYVDFTKNAILSVAKT